MSETYSPQADEWREVRIGDLVKSGALMVSDGYRVRNEELGPIGIPFVRGGDIGNGWINTFTEDHIRPEFADRVRIKLTRPGDTAFITKGTVGRAGYLRPGQEQVVFAPQVAYWRVLDAAVLDSRFLFYLITSHAFQANLDSVKTHGAMVADYVSISQQHDFLLRIPGVRVQRGIGSILGTLDDKIELNRKMSATLEAIARALFKSWFVDFDPVRAKAEGRDPGLPAEIAALFPDSFDASNLGQIPKGWRCTAVSEITDLIKGKSYKSADLRESETALVTLKSFARGGGYKQDGLKPYAGDYKQSQVVRPGDLVVACTDVTQAAEIIGRPAIVLPSDSYHTLVASLDLLIVKPTTKAGSITVPFLYCLFQTGRFVDHAYAHTTGTTVLHLSGQALPSFVFARPSDSLVKAFTEVAEPLFHRGLTANREVHVLSRLRNALLPKLISGELRVSDAESILAAST